MLRKYVVTSLVYVWALTAKLGSPLHLVSTRDLLQAIELGRVMIRDVFRKMDLVGLKWGKTDGE